MTKSSPVILACVSVLMVFSCHKKKDTTKLSRENGRSGVEVLTPFECVNPFIGTGGHGHTYPGATAPFGMVQLSPDTRIEGWDGCSGYHYSDNYIYGFSHTHLQGTGVPDYCDILFMPTNNKLKTADNWGEAYKSKFRHETEEAQPGYYKVYLDDYNITADFTTTTRTGIHRYKFAQGDSCRMFIDMMHRDELLYYDIQTIGDTAIQGYRVSKGWAQQQHCYFYAVFSKPFRDFTQLDIIRQQPDNAGKMQLVMEQVQVFSFKFDVTDEVMVKVGISGVDMDGAANNLYSEAPHWNFEKYRADVKSNWETCLAKAPITETNPDELAKYYTALYHCYTVPNTWSDADGRYRGMDNKIHLAEGYTRYTVFSLWDTFRAYHPLMSELEPERTRDWIVTFLEMYKERGELPVWELAGNETYCMIGYHSVPVIVDAYMRNIKDFDTKLALEAMVKSATGPQEEKVLYDSLGYVPSEKFSESVSKTLEFAYDDWCIAQFAKALGDETVYKRFTERSQNWKNLFDPDSKFMRPRRNGGFPHPFDPYQVDFNFTEANAWQYAYFVPHDIETLVEYVGGNVDFFNHVSALFYADSNTTGREQADITGLIGQYAHGNEPSHHAAFLFNYGNTCYEPSCYATYEKVQKIMKELYRNSPDGLCGNEDCGQMSAWFVLAKNNLYSLCPGQPEFISFNPYIQKEHKYILGGHEVKVSEKPQSKVKDYLIQPLPIISGPQIPFEDKAEVEINIADTSLYFDAIIQKEGERERHYNALKHGHKFKIDADVSITAFTNQGSAYSKASHATFSRRKSEWTILKISEFDNQYHAGGREALIDGIRGANDFRTGQWQGFRGDLSVEIDLKKEKPITSVSISCLEEIKSWIWFPSEIQIYLSHDAETWANAGVIKVDEPKDNYTPRTKVFNKNMRASARYVRLVAKQAYPVIPDWHIGKGGKSWIFADEVIIK